MRFVMLGFTQDSAIRKFRFQAIAAEQARVEIAVEADLALLRRFQISTQELPLLCWRVLQKRGSAEGLRSVTITESDMREHAGGRDSTDAAAPAQRLFQTRKTGGMLGSPAPSK